MLLFFFGLQDEFRERLLAAGVVHHGGFVKVSGFLNHMVDAPLLDRMAREIVTTRLNGLGITKVVTVPTSGVAVAMPFAIHLGVPLLFTRDYLPASMRGDEVASVTYPSRTKARRAGHGVGWAV